MTPPATTSPSAPGLLTQTDLATIQFSAVELRDGVLHVAPCLKLCYPLIFVFLVAVGKGDFPSGH